MKKTVCMYVCILLYLNSILLERVAHVVAAGFLSCYLNGPLLYVRRHIAVTKCVECVVK